MYQVHLLDLKSGKDFYKIFNSEYLLNKFVNKCRRGAKLQVLSIIKNY